MSTLQPSLPSAAYDIKYKQLLSRKRSWSPPQTSSEMVLTDAITTLDKALALRGLEIPVGDFISEGLGKSDGLSNICIELLKSNIQDELKHDISLNNLYQSVGLNNKKTNLEAESIIKAWVELDEHPLAKALFLERSVFFIILPMFRWLSGDNYSMRTVASEISQDEVGHVSTNTNICRQLNLGHTEAINNLRVETLNWLLSDLKLTTATDKSKVRNTEHLNKDFWLRSSESLYFNGAAPELKDTEAPRMPAFFESSRKTQAIYS